VAFPQWTVGRPCLAVALAREQGRRQAGNRRDAAKPRDSPAVHHLAIWVATCDLTLAVSFDDVGEEASAPRGSGRGGRRGRVGVAGWAGTRCWSGRTCRSRRWLQRRSPVRVVGCSSTSSGAGRSLGCSLDATCHIATCHSDDEVGDRTQADTSTHALSKISSHRCASGRTESTTSPQLGLPNCRGGVRTLLRSASDS
jgi:hypothetical protein